MSLGWIKIETCLPQKPEVMKLAELLGIDEFAVVGHLVCFWAWVDANVSLDCPVVIGTKRGLDRVSGRDGFCDAMIAVGWLQIDGSQVSIPHLEYHLDKTAKTRAMESRKKARQRSVTPESPKCPDAIGTNQGSQGGPEKRREEIESVYEPPKPQQTQKPSESHPGGIDEVIIPSKMQTPACLEAARKFWQYLSEKGADYKRPDLSATALEAWWREMARIGPAKFPEAVERSMAGGHLSVKVLPDPAEAYKGPKAKPDTNADWLHALNICRKYSTASQQDTLARREELTPAQLAAVRDVGLHRIAQCTSYDYKQVSEQFLHAMKGAASEAK
jgi:hypothetical protein